MSTERLAAPLLFTLVANVAAQTQFVERTPVTVAAAPMQVAVAADLDGDGDLDLCGGASVFAPGPRVHLLGNQGGERFADLTATHLPPLPPSATAVFAIVPIDMDGDGDLDLFVSANGTALLWRNVGSLAFVDASGNLPANGGWFGDAVVADFDGDGDLDLAAAGSASNGSYNQMFANQGNGVFGPSYGFTGNQSLAAVGVDIDMDGDLDLITGENAGGLTVRRNDGGLVFTDVSTTWVPPGIGGRVLDVAALDFDGDGRVDLALARQNAGSDLLLRHTGAAFVIRGSLSTSAAGTRSLQAIDVDEDGDVDLFRAGVTGTVTLALNDGLGAFTTAPSRVPGSSTTLPSLVGGDFDRDGDVDVLVCEPLFGPVLFVNRHRDLRPGQPVVGQPWQVEIWSEPGYATLDHTVRLAIGAAALPHPLVLPGLGELWLDLGGGFALYEGVVLVGSGRHTFPVPVPPLPALVGIPLYVQGLCEQAPGPARLTAHFGLIVQ